MFEKLKTQIDLIQKSVDSASVKMEINSDDFIKKHAPKLPNLDSKLEQFKSKLANKKKKKQNQRNIFEEVISVVNKFLEAGRSVNDSSRFASTQRLRQHVIDSVEVTSNSAKQILMDCVKSAFFANGGICGTDRFLTGADMDSVVISPKEIDFLNMFRVPPNSDYGAIMYENPKRRGGNKVQVNTGLYNSFTGGTFEYETPSNKTLFTSTWNTSDQTFNISGLTQGSGVGQYGIIKVEDFFNDYYSNIEMPDLNEIVKKAMLLTLKAASVSADKTGVKVGGSATGMENPLDFTPSLDEAINNLERMLNKLFAFCNNQTERLSGQTPTNLFHENEEPDRFIKRCMIANHDNATVTIHEDKYFDFVYVDDFIKICTYYFDNCNNKEVLEKTINICYTEKYTLSDIAKLILSNKDKIEIIKSTSKNNYSGKNDLLHNLNLNLDGLEKSLTKYEKAFLSS